MKHCYFFRCLNLHHYPQPFVSFIAQVNWYFGLGYSHALTALERFEIEDWDIPRGEKKKHGTLLCFQI